MSAAEQIARAFHEAYEQIAPHLGYETRPESRVPWEQVPARNRAVMVATVSFLLERREISVPTRLRKREGIGHPDSVARDVDEADKLLVGLAGMYRAAHDAVLGPSGGGEAGVGRGSLVDVDPTGDAVADRRRAALRGEVRRASRLIGDARNSLTTARQLLEPLAQAPGFRQPKKVDPKAVVDQDELEASLSAQERRMGGRSA